jgi:hypothetical protein
VEPKEYNKMIWWIGLVFVYVMIGMIVIGYFLTH